MKPTVEIEIDDKALDVVTEKTDRLIELMKEAQQIIGLLSDIGDRNLQKKEGEEMEQSEDEMRIKIRRSSNRKILRRQIEMLTEYSRTCGVERAPEACQAISSLHKELFKVENRFLVSCQIALLGFLYVIKCISVKGIQFIER